MQKKSMVNGENKRNYGETHKVESQVDVPVL
jgi:hypothetical protein